MHHLDELLEDLQLRLGTLTRFKQWLLPIDPGDFAPATTHLLARHAALSVHPPVMDMAQRRTGSPS